jgi:hypothetical protein
MSLSALPMDAQASILAFLPHGDLARFSEISRGCCGVATTDRLWIPMLQHFKVELPFAIFGFEPSSLFPFACHLLLLRVRPGLASD